MSIGEIIGVCTGVCSLFGVIYVAVVRIAKLEMRVDTMWEFLMRRAMTEALTKGIAEKNSPLVVTPEAKAWMASLAAELKAFYRRLGHTMTDAQLALEIERRWGNDIVENVCIPHGLTAGACLIIAVEVAKEIEATQS